VPTVGRQTTVLPLDVLTAQDALLKAQLQYASEAFGHTVFYLDLVARLVI
jgi:hypothetical protein